MEKNIQDSKLVKDILRYVLHDYYPAVHWKPDGIFLEDIDDSPSSVTIKSAIKWRLDTYGSDVHSFYDEDFPRKDVIDETDHFDALRYIKSDFEIKVFDFANFLDYLCMCSEYAALSYLYGVMTAPFITHQIVCSTMLLMREGRKITEDFWADFEKFCENFVDTERWGISMRKH